MEFYHFSHEHPMILHKDLNENNNDQEIACYGCELPIMGPCYSCGGCNFSLHVSCAELPIEIKHWLHPKHPLTLSEKWHCHCDACGHPIRNLAYNCSLCNFNLDLRCVSIPRTIEHCGHEHPFTLLTKKSKFCCDACGEEGEGMSYFCTTCLFWVHLECASLPSIIKLSDHIHPLTLAYSLNGDESRQCQICDEEVKTDHWVYQCDDCSYLAHVGCTIVPPKRHNTRKLTRERGGERDRQIDNETKAVTDRDNEAEAETEAETESSNHYVPNLNLNQSASLQKTLVHFGHEHPLRVMVNDVEFDCDACGTNVKGSFSYICTTCQFWVHSECALLPKTIKLADHNHPFTLTSSNELDDSNDCVLCHEKVINTNYWVYYSVDCHSVAHMHCAKEIARKAGIILIPNDNHQEGLESGLMSFPNEYNDLLSDFDVEKLTSLGEKTAAGEFKHFSHPHSLTLCEDMENEGKCHGCAEYLLGPAYTCSKCKYFLHKSSAELPMEILNHPLHPHHPLSLLVNLPYYYARCLCSACGHSVRHFVYHCSLCKFDLDLKCVPLHRTIQHHNHPLIMLQQLAKFACYACGTAGDGNSYLCTTCLVLFHLECVSSPNTIKLTNHNHSLRLCSRFDYNSTSKYFCAVCDLRMKLDHWYYSCEEFNCNCVAHWRCAISKKRTADCNDVSALDPMPIPDESIFLATDDVKNCVGEETKAIELNHFGHQHRLTMFDEIKAGKQCNGCTQPISGPFYSCSECNFFLHKSCTRLRSEIRHPFHLEHQLKLFAKRPSSDGFFDCNICWALCNGFCYVCEYCNIQLDILCSSILGGLKHEAHEHVLTLSSLKGGEDSCKACGLYFGLFGKQLRCSDCNFNMHIGCATLPGTVWHKIHRHPFTLTYDLSNEDESDEYYCDICEEERNPKQWFYNCAECEYPAHVSCMVGRYRRIKLGAVLNIEGHRHSVTVVEKVGPDGSLMMDLHCAECNTSVESYPCRVGLMDENMDLKKAKMLLTQKEIRKWIVDSRKPRVGVPFYDIYLF